MHRDVEDYDCCLELKFKHNESYKLDYTYKTQLSLPHYNHKTFNKINCRMVLRAYADKEEGLKLKGRIWV